MAWGDRKPEGNEKTQLPSGFLSPQALDVGPLNITVKEGQVPTDSPRSGGLIRARRPENRVSNTRPYHRCRDVYRCEYSPGRVRSLKATVFFVALRLLTLPGERYPTGQHQGAEALSASRRKLTSGDLGFLAGLLRAGAAGDFGVRGEGPIDFDAIAFLESLIGPSQSAENTERRIREIHAGEIRVESGQTQGVGNAGTRREVQGLDDAALRLGVGDLDPEGRIVQ